MDRVVFGLACMAYAGHGRQAQTISEQLQRDPLAKTRLTDAIRDPLAKTHLTDAMRTISGSQALSGKKPMSQRNGLPSLAMLFLTLNSAPGFNPSSSVARFPSGSPMSAGAYRGIFDRHNHLSNRLQVLNEILPAVDLSNKFKLGRSAEMRMDADGSNPQEKLGVVLINLGGPDSLDSVEPFLYNLFADSEVITFPSFLKWLNIPLAFLISKGRAPQSREKYASIGGYSPQLETTEAQGRAIVEALAARGVAAESYVAMRYWSPFTSDAIRKMKEDGVQRVVVLPLYPQFSVSTTGSSLRVLEQEFYADQSLQTVPNIVIPAWYNRDGYINALARLVAEKCDLSPSGKSVPHILFSAHGLPVNFVEEKADPYKVHTESTVALATNRLRQLGYTNNITLTFQSRVGPVEWLRPYTDDVIRELGARGVREIIVVPVSFVSEHIETLEELDMEYKEVAEEAGITGWQRVPTLGLESDFIDDLAEAVIEVMPRLKEPANPEVDQRTLSSLREINDVIRNKGDLTPKWRSAVGTPV